MTNNLLQIIKEINNGGNEQSIGLLVAAHDSTMTDTSDPNGCFYTAMGLVSVLGIPTAMLHYSVPLDSLGGIAMAGYSLLAAAFLAIETIGNQPASKGYYFKPDEGKFGSFIMDPRRRDVQCLLTPTDWGALMLGDSGLFIAPYQVVKTENRGVVEENRKGVLTGTTQQVWEYNGNKVVYTQEHYSAPFIEILERHDVTITMDGNGLYTAKVYIGEGETVLGETEAIPVLGRKLRNGIRIIKPLDYQKLPEKVVHKGDYVRA